MLSIEDVKKAERLIQERDLIAIAKWPILKGETMRQQRHFSSSEEFSLPVDEPLAMAIEEFRKRKLDAIDAQLRELGVEPPQMKGADSETVTPSRTKIKDAPVMVIRRGA
jgi:hypothetical protein